MNITKAITIKQSGDDTMIFQPKTPYDKVRKCITTGCVTNQEISQTVGDLESLLGVQERQAFHDEVSDASRYFTLGGRKPGFFGRLYLAGKDIVDKTANAACVVAGAAVGAEYEAAKAFAGSILAGKLTNPGDHMAYWLGKKTVEVSGPDMLNALYQLTTSTPQIVMGMGLGAMVGWLGYKLARNLAKGVYNNWRVSATAQRIVGKYHLDRLSSGNTQPSDDKVAGEHDKKPSLSVVKGLRGKNKPVPL